MQKSIIEGNVIIAKGIGLERKGINVKYLPSYFVWVFTNELAAKIKVGKLINVCVDEDLKFESDWNWLNHAIDCIREKSKLTNVLNVYKVHDRYECRFGDGDTQISGAGETPILAQWDMCVSYFEKQGS